MDFTTLLEDIARIHGTARGRAGQALNQLLCLRNWLIGACIIEYEQLGEDRAAYGDRLLPRLADDLTTRGFSGLSSRTLKNCRQVALAFPGLEIRQTLSAVFGDSAPALIRHTSAETPEEVFPSLARRHADSSRLPWQDAVWYRQLFARLSFSHLLELSRIDDPLARAFYELESIKAGWSVRELKRQRDSMLFERIGLSRDKDAVMAFTQEGALLERPGTVLRDPYVLEFLGLEHRTTFSESELEQALVDHLQQFIHELGRDFCFVERQARITVGGRHHFLDLLFYHRGLRCMIAIDLKVGAFHHENAGQMNFYLNYIAENISRPDENPPVGILLCADKDAEEVHYATAGLDQAIFVSRYLVALPSEEQLTGWLREERVLLQRHERGEEPAGTSEAKDT